MLTIDASAWINAVNVSEVDHASSKSFLAQVIASRTPVVVPTLLRVVVAATFGRAGNMMAVMEFTQRVLLFDFIQWVSVDNTLADSASRIAVSHQLRGADAIYAAVVKDYGCKLVSRDGNHLKRLAGTIDALDPDAALALIAAASP